MSISYLNRHKVSTYCPVLLPEHYIVHNTQSHTHIHTHIHKEILKFGEYVMERSTYLLSYWEMTDRVLTKISPFQVHFRLHSFPSVLFDQLINYIHGLREHISHLRIPSCISASYHSQHVHICTYGTSWFWPSDCVLESLMCLYMFSILLKSYHYVSSEQ